jgi:hypothetical protein
MWLKTSSLQHFSLGKAHAAKRATRPNPAKPDQRKYAHAFTNHAARLATRHLLRYPG